MKPFKIDVPVAIIFFNRSDTLEKVFDQVKAARPSKLFLIQDGPRDGSNNDTDNIAKCREIVERVDWHCEIHKDYSEKNLGCGSRVSSGLNNAFKIVDRLIILEDDCVPSQSMFTFCEEVLEKYKDDERINMISGMNHLGEYMTNTESYIFCKTGAIWGWATWKRVWDLYDYEMTFFKNEYLMETYKSLFLPKYYKNKSLMIGKKRYNDYQNGKKQDAWTYQFGMIRHMYSQIIIVPRVNLISNIGVNINSTHGSSLLKQIPKKIQRIFFMKAHEMEIPLVHPKYLIIDNNYDKSVWLLMGESRVHKLIMRCESIIRRLIYR